MSPRRIPRDSELMWFVLQAVQGLGGSAHISEISEYVQENSGFSKKELRSLGRISSDGRRSVLNYRLAWARTSLKEAGFLGNSSRGVWFVTKLTKGLTRQHFDLFIRRRSRTRRGVADSLSQDEQSGYSGLTVDTVEDSWKSSLLDHLYNLDSDAFERLTQRLLREAGFIKVIVTGRRSGDGGIDGEGIYRPSLLSVPMVFQCKRYTNTRVSVSVVRDFRGAMSGRAEKGILITTSSFTEPARTEATRPGATIIDLIDGDELCDLLKYYELGVSSWKGEDGISQVEIDSEFFYDV